MVDLRQDVVRRHVERWTRRVSRRIRAHDPRRPVWDRAGFMRELTTDAPDLPFAEAVALAAVFEDAIAAARGSSARFEEQIGRRCGVYA
jgi:hypothetical protein